jgi:hypothetical protein
MFIDTTLHVPNKLHVTGASLPGVPFVWMGRNKDLSWSFTPSSIDIDDLFRESISIAEGGGSRTYLHSYSHTEQSAPHLEGESEQERSEVRTSEVWDALGTQIEEFFIKDAKSSAGPEYRSITIHHTHRGPLIIPYLTSASGKTLGDSSLQLSLSRCATAGHFKMAALMQTNTASGWEDFLNALHGLDAMSMNVLYSDRRGNIASTVTGRSPVRVEGHDGSFVVPGSGFAWSGTESSLDCENCEAAQYRHFNPPSKLLVSAPWHVVDSLFIQHLRDLAAAAARVTEADVMALECDDHSESLYKLKQTVLDTPDSYFKDEDVIVKLLLESNEDSAPALQQVFLEAFRIEIADNLLRRLQSIGNQFRGESHSPLKLSNVYSG